MKRYIGAACAVVIAALVAAGVWYGVHSGQSSAHATRVNASPTPTASRTLAAFTVHGLLTLKGDSDGISDDTAKDQCEGTGGFDDLTGGQEVDVTDQSGGLVAVGTLHKGLIAGSTTCMMTFTVPGVPPGGGFYGVRISHRGTLHYTEQQLRSGPTLSIG